MLRGDVVKDDSGAYAVFTEQGSSASQMTAAKVMDVIARLSDNAGEASDAVSAYTKVKMEDAPKFLNISKVRVSSYMDTTSTTQVAQITVKHRRPRGSSRTKFIRTTACWPLLGKTFLRKFYSGLGWEKYRMGMCIGSSETRIVLIGVRG